MCLPARKEDAPTVDIVSEVADVVKGGMVCSKGGLADGPGGGPGGGGSGASNLVCGDGKLPPNAAGSRMLGTPCLENPVSMENLRQ
jgi:hypothetical protein